MEEDVGGGRAEDGIENRVEAREGDADGGEPEDV